MLELRTRLLLMIGGGVLLVGLIIGSILLKKESNGESVVVAPEDTSQTEVLAPTEQPTVQTQPDESVSATKVPTIQAPVPQTQEEKQALFARQISRDFVERLLSYSNKNANKHLDDVELLVTPTMWNWVKTQTVVAEAGTVSQQTKVVSTAVNSIGGDTANIAVGIQQIIVNAEGVKTEYKKGRVELLQLNGTWKVNGLFWE